MKLPQNKTLLRWILIVAAFLVVALILWNTNIFFQKFKQEERAKMEVIASAIKNMNSPDLNRDITLEGEILAKNTNIPMIVTTEEGKIKLWANLEIERGADYENLPTLERSYLSKQLKIMKSDNEPFQVSYEGDSGTVSDFIYYRDSDILNKLQYYPLALLLILFLFGTIIYLVFKSNKAAEQNRLWAGMAKETAHQIGTPLSSLLGWVEILRMENADEATVVEIEKDVERLNTIADRFSKIGSIPKLQRYDLVGETKEAFDYYESRSSKLIDFNFEIINKDKIYAMINPQLFSWVIENLVKNAIDAMQGKGTITIQIGSKDDKFVKINVIDNGKGIAKNLFRKIFDPGYTTKKRGWGLGLSLTKRIIEDYHGGRVYVEKSELDKGTTFTVLLNEL
ncbi:MAG: HAMP domain-containing sensor histidine kinase [Flavobacteriaceae bacterium]|nr:HAMP domain-containing sensor histidine kinase [Flavobacteriaceae bacterium]